MKFETVKASLPPRRESLDLWYGSKVGDIDMEHSEESDDEADTVKS